MYKALFDFTSTEPKTLKIRQGDCFTIVEYGDEHWLVAQNGKGEVGFIPRAYIAKDDKKVAIEDVMKFIDRSIESIHFAASDLGAYTSQQRDNLQKLIHHRRSVVENMQNVNEHSPGAKPVNKSSLSADGRSRKGRAPPIPDPNRTVIERIAPPTPPRVTFTSPPITNGIDKPYDKAAGAETTRDASPSNPIRAPAVVGAVQASVPEELGAQLVELVRASSGLSHDKSQTTVCKILDRLGATFPAIEQIMQDISAQISNSETVTSDIGTSHDAARLDVIFTELTACKDDSQQRGWALHEDQAIILEYLDELLSILTNANPTVCRHIVQREHYQVLDTLLLYYQMETRWSIRIVLLRVFGALCALEAKIITHLLYSVLPLELARDIQSDRENVQKFRYSTLVLSMLFSSGEPLPFHHYGQLNEEFVQFLLDEGEQPRSSDESDEILESAVTTVLAFNLHLLDPVSNVVMHALARKGTAKAFTEKVMNLMNSGVDPVCMFDHYHPAPPNSVYKLLSDLFSNRTTAGLLYTNDAKVLIDILLRNITDLSPGTARTEFLSLVDLIIQNSVYGEHQHRRLELERCFHKIVREDGRESDVDQQIVCRILESFPQYFAKP